jgi:hypothetical protein
MKRDDLEKQYPGHQFFMIQAGLFPSGRARRMWIARKNGKVVSRRYAHQTQSVAGPGDFEVHSPPLQEM